MLLTTTQAGKKLGIGKRRVLALITSGRLKAQKVGAFHLIEETDLAAVATRKPGRPPKVKHSTGS